MMSMFMSGCGNYVSVMAGLDPGIHVFLFSSIKSWMAEHKRVHARLPTHYARP